MRPAPTVAPMGTRRYYHASPAELAIGEALRPDTRGRVFLSADKTSSHDWAHLLNADHVYLIEPVGPVTSRYEKDATGDREWVAAGGVVVGYVGKVREAAEYCDGCLPKRAISRAPGDRQGPARTVAD